MESPITKWPGEPLDRERERFKGESTGWIQWKGIADDCVGAPKSDSSDYRVDQALDVPQ